MWLNLTLFNQSALFTVIRELEYVRLQLTHQVDELVMAVQYTLSGKLPMTIIGPNVLHSVLRNIYVCLKIMNSLPVPNFIIFTCITNCLK
jgi:hypothetical protein